MVQKRAFPNEENRNGNGNGNGKQLILIAYVCLLSMTKSKKANFSISCFINVAGGMGRVWALILFNDVAVKAKGKTE